MDDKFRDFIPAGEDTGAIGDGGFRDYVPPAEPKPQTVANNPVQPQQVPQPNTEGQEDVQSSQPIPSDFIASEE